MKKLRLPLLTILLTMALVGLVGLQLYWTKMAYKIVQQRFKQTAHEALHAVAQKLEQREIIYATQRSAMKLQDSLKFWEKQRVEYEQLRTAQIRTIQITEEQFKPSQLKQTNHKTAENLKSVFVYKPDKVYFSQHLDITTHLDSFQIQGSFQSAYITTSRNSTNISCLPALPTSTQPKQQSKQQVVIQPVHIAKLPEKKFIKIESKEDVLKFLVQEIRQIKPDLNKRLGKRMLDSLIKRELNERGIYLPYTFGVEVLPRCEIPTTHTVYANKQISHDLAQLSNLNSYEKPIYFFFDTPAIQTATLQSAFHTPLYPTEIVGNRNTLFVNFSQEINWLWREMAFTGGASLLFIALIIGCFAYTLYTIWRQKKISEITHDFINNMTHEFKTPVATVSLACEALQDPDMRKIPTYTDRYLQIIKEENERLGRQVERVLQIAVLDRTDFRLKLQPCDLHDIALKALHNIDLQVESRQGIVETRLHATKTCLQADEVHLTNVILNLLDNALKYSPETPHITVCTNNEAHGICIAITDKGQGMSKEAQGKVFDKFYRVSTGNVHNVKGFGLGLSYVRTISTAHHGRVSVQSEVGKGSTFTVFLPFEQV